MNFSGWRGFAVCCFLLLALPAALAHAEPSRIARPDGIDDASWASLKRAIGATVIEAKLAAEAGAEGDRMGYAIALEGDTALVAARYDDFAGAVDRGSVYVFTRSGTSWSQQAKLVAGDGAENDEFGTSVALSGNTAVVGAVFDDVGANADQGSVYVFTRTGTIWTQQAKLTAADGAAGDRFGASVAASGDTVLVGAWSDAVGANAAQGSAYAFTRSGSTWTQQAKLLASDGAADDRLGWSVALSGNTAVVSAAFDDNGANANQGAVYAFLRSGSTWSQQAKMVAADGAANDQFGFSVALSGQTAAIGANLNDVGANADQGSVYVYITNGTTWSFQSQLTAADGAAQDQLGARVSLSGESLLAGAWLDDVAANVDQGSAYVYTRSGVTWSQQARLLAADGAAADSFGWALALSGDTAVVGAQFDVVDGIISAGSASVLTRAGAVWTQTAPLRAEGGEPNDRFGAAVAVSGDTALVAASWDRVGFNSFQGSVHVYIRVAGTWAHQARLMAADGVAGDYFGESLALDGNTALVGVPRDGVGANVEQGSAYVFVRNGSTWTQEARLVAADGAASDQFGYAVDVSGNTAVVGAWRDDASAANQGSAYVFVRSGTTWTQQARLLAADAAGNDAFGSSVAVSGDIALASAPFNDISGRVDQGAAYVYVRSGTTWTQQAQLLAADGAADDLFGRWVDIDGTTALVGAFLDDVGANVDQGSAYVFVRSGSSWPQQARLVAADGAANDRFGNSVALSGGTALVGGLNGTSNQGSAYLYTRDGSTWIEQFEFLPFDGLAGDGFGGSVAVSGIHSLVGAELDDVGSNADQGSAYSYTVPQADLSITKTDGLTEVAAGASTTYTIVASNAGPLGTNATVTDTFPLGLTCTWTCTAAGGATCAASGSGNINAAVTLPSGSSITYTASCAVALGAPGQLSNTATVTGPEFDPVPSNNSATDETTATCPPLTVTNRNNTGPGSLRRAVTDANTCGPPDVITINTTGDINLASALPDITSDLTIIGPGANLLTINGDDTFRLLAAGLADVDLSVSGLTLAHGGVPAAGGVAAAISMGDGELVVDDVHFRDHVGIRVMQSITAAGVRISNSTISASPGSLGIFVNGAPLRIQNSTFSGLAGGIDCRSTECVVEHSTFVSGAGLAATNAQVYLRNSVLDAATITGSTYRSYGNNQLSDNSLPNPVSTDRLGSGDILLAPLGAYGGSMPTHAILPGSELINRGTADEVQRVSVTGGAGTFTLTFNGQTTAPLAFNATAEQVQTALQGLSSIGTGNAVVGLSGTEYFFTFTNARGGANQPQTTAAGAGGASVSAQTLFDGGIAVDQRGIARGLGADVDIGAFESRGFTLAIISGDMQFTAPSSPFPNPLVVGVAPIAPGEPVNGGRVTFLGRVGFGSPTATMSPPNPTISGGSASTIATANGNFGDHPIRALTSGAPAEVEFTLLNMPPTTVSINNRTLTEGDTGTTNAVFTVNRSTVFNSFNLPYTVVAGTAEAGSDYTLASGTLNFPMDGAFSATITVPVVGDTRVEGVETATVQIGPVQPVLGAPTISDGTGLLTINDNDSAVVNLTPATLSQSEATSPMTFTATLSNPVQSGVTLTLTGTDGTATSADYSPNAATVNFPANSAANQAVAVTITNDTLDEPDETFSLALSGLTATGNVTLGTVSAAATIVDDDAPPTLSITSPSQAEGNSGTSTMNFVVSLSSASGRVVGFTRATADGSATVANNDYVAIPAGSLSIPAGQTSITIPVTLVGDTTNEGDESFSLNLSGVSNATPGALTGIGTLVEDDVQNTTTTITADLPDPSVVGQPYPVNVTVAATVSSPAGTVTITDGTASCGPVTLTAGTAPNATASCSLTSTTAGAKTLTASYTAATVAFANSSGTASHQVNPASTALSVSGPPRSRINQATAFSFALAVNAPGAGTPSGTVTLTSGAASCTATLPATNCSLTFDAPGTRTVNASYSGDANFSASSSSGAGNSQTLVYAQSDLSVSKSDAATTFQPGGLIVYTVQVRNVGPDVAQGIRVRDDVPAGLASVSWSCAASGGVACPAASGSGGLDQTVASFPVNGLLTYAYSGTAQAVQQILNQALVELPLDTTVEDLVPGNNSASDLNRNEFLMRDGFENPPTVRAAGSFRLPGLALASAVGEVAVAVYRLDDVLGEALRVYARKLDGRMQYALALRGADGSWQLGAWQALDGEPLLSWTVIATDTGIRLQGATLR